MKFLKIIILGSILVFSSQFVFATWSPPPTTPTPASPPNNNATSSLNVSNIPQTKVGGLIVASGGGITTGFLVPNGNVGIGFFDATNPPAQKLDVSGYIKATGFCIGSNCITAWPPSNTSGFTGVKKIIPGPGISVSPTSGTGVVTITNTGVGTATGATIVKLFCIANNPATHNVCPSNPTVGTGWISAGVFDNGGSSWCVASTTGAFIKTPSSDVVICYKTPSP